VAQTGLSYFCAACQILGMNIGGVRYPSTSSELKGESQEDSVRTFSSYFDLIIMRTQTGGLAERMAWMLSNTERPVPIVNAGSGKDQHPTQALLDIYTISVSQIADQYIQYMDMMESLNLDGVGDFLVMAATLAYHKSRMLLPRTEGEEAEEEDEYESLEELHRRLIEYQRYKEAAQELKGRDLLNRDVFKVHVHGEFEKPDPADAPIKVSLFDLLDAFQGILKTLPKESVHEVIPERIRLVDRIMEVMDLLVERNAVALTELVGEAPSRQKVVVTFLSILELVRMQLVRAYQFEPFGPIQIRLVSGEGDPKAKLKESMPHYEP